MKPRKIRPKAHIKKFLKDNKEAIKGLEKMVGSTKKYTREPWMAGVSPVDDRYEGFLYKESDSL